MWRMVHRRFCPGTIPSSVFRGKPVLRVVRLCVPVLEQLKIEEALFRADEEKQNWCVINRIPEDASPCVVLGISARVEQLVHRVAALEDGIPLIKRFTGGGTVFVDQGTCMVSLITGQKALPDIKPFPRQIMNWTEQWYGRVFQAAAHSRGIDSAFALREHDYSWADRKFGGNAQSVSTDRWLHHTSFLYRMDIDRMSRYIKIPDRSPDYRAQRGHSEFLTTLESLALFDSMHAFHEAAIGALAEWYDLTDVSAQEVRQRYLDLDHYKRTQLLSTISEEKSQ